MRLAIAAALLLFPIGAKAVPVTPNFTNGTVTSRTESTTTVTETIRQTDFQTGWTYTATGTNVIPSTGNFEYGATYSVVVPGQAFQFSETYMGPGVSKETFIERTTVVESVTDSLSVFSQ